MSWNKWAFSFISAGLGWFSRLCSWSPVTYSGPMRGTEETWQWLRALCIQSEQYNCIVKYSFIEEKAPLASWYVNNGSNQVKILCKCSFIGLWLARNKRAGKKGISYYWTNLVHHESWIFQIMVISVGGPDIIQIDLLLNERNTNRPYTQDQVSKDNAKA